MQIKLPEIVKVSREITSFRLRKKSWNLLLTDHELTIKIFGDVVFPLTIFPLIWRTPMEEMISLSNGVFR